MIWDKLIKNAHMVTASGDSHGDIYIKDGRIAAITQCGKEEGLGEAAEVIDAAGMLVFPGFIDTHCHSRDGSKGAWQKEDFAHSSMAAAAGGITTILEMPNCNPAIYSVENLQDLIETITPKAYVDFGVWGLCLGDLNKDQLKPLADAGVVAFKFFWGYAIDAKTYQLIYNYEEGMKDVIPPFSTGEVYELFRNVAKTGKKIAIHAEDFGIIKTLTAEAREKGMNDYDGMLYSRPDFSETIVIDTAIRIAEATGADLHILHLAAGDGVEIIERARKKGSSVTAETCPHYLGLTSDDYAHAGTSMKGYPPVRTKYDKELLWKGLADGVISFVASDHAPHTPEEKAQDIWSAPAGMVTIETMAPVLIDGVNHGRISWNRLAEVLSEAPAKMFGLYPSKGSLEVGTDADITIIDPDMEYVMDQTKLHSRTKLSPFDGRHMKGKPVCTIVRGKTVMKDGEIKGDPSGRFIRPEW